jgi:hypothetical protein
MPIPYFGIKESRCGVENGKLHHSQSLINESRAHGGDGVQDRHRGQIWMFPSLVLVLTSNITYLSREARPYLARYRVWQT